MATFKEIRQKLGDTITVSVPDVNVKNFLPPSVAPPAAVLRTLNPTGDYMTTMGEAGGGYAEWLFEILLIIGKVSDESAQDFLGDLISRDSPLIQALNDIEFAEGPGYGHAHVRKVTNADIKVGAEKYACARITVLVRA